MKGKSFLVAFGYALAAGGSIFQACLLFQKTGRLYSGVVFFAGIAFFSVLSCGLLVSRLRSANVFVKGWNWIFLVLSLLAVWLGVPEVRIPSLYLLGFATLTCALR